MNYINKLLFSTDYGFFDEIPKEQIRKLTMINIDHFNWYTTDDFTKAKNHCAAVTSTNLDLYFTKLNYFSKEDVFNEHHSKIKNGPVLSFKNKTKKILSSKGKEIKSKTFNFNKIKHIKESVNNNNISAILLNSSLFSWHWILCVGYIELYNNTDVLIIIDNWYNKIRYYTPNKKSKIISVIKFYEDKN